MSRFGLRVSVPALALALSLGLIGVAVGVVAAKPGGKCADQIAGTYYRPTDLMVTLAKDGTLVGQYSPTTQEGPAGLGQSFSGTWACKGTQVTLQQFRFLDNSGNRYFEQGDATGNFDGTNTLTLTYIFHAYPEDTSAADVRAGVGGGVVGVPPIELGRVSTL
jgi:hypothetical protein